MTMDEESSRHPGAAASPPPEGEAPSDASSPTTPTTPAAPATPAEPTAAALPATPAATSATSPSHARTARRHHQREEGARVIFEQILIALVLAFVFRAFVVEAFVIPTGSMATTLLGAHMRFDCPDCGWHYTVNHQRPFGPGPRTYGIRCENCDFRLPRENPADQASAATSPQVHHGDRILVLKHYYLFASPSRWDVVVFKNPSRRDETGQIVADPESTEPHQQNYIKRLIGLPGDTLMLLDGNVYYSRANKPLGALLPEDFQIARKTDTAQQALWRIVYHDDFRPQGLDRVYQGPAGRPFTDQPFQLPWQQVDGAGWDINPTPEGGGFNFDNQDGGGVLAFNPVANPAGAPLSDFLTYNITRHDQQIDRTYRNDTLFFDLVRDHPQARFNTVTDLKLSFYYHRLAGEGALRISLSKHDDRFEAELVPGRARLVRHTADGQELLIGEAPAPDFGRPRLIELINADYRVRLVVDGRTVLETTDYDYSPDVQLLLARELEDASVPLPVVAIAGDRQRAEIRHLSLWRDVFYTARRDEGRNYYPWASPVRFPNHAIRLGEGEYFTVGDNPFLSGDARNWTERLVLRYEDLDVESGRVPERFLLGRAFFVYWPAGFTPVPGLPIPAPNFGEMRFIR